MHKSFPEHGTFKGEISAGTRRGLHPQPAGIRYPPPGGREGGEGGRREEEREGEGRGGERRRGEGRDQQGGNHLVA